MKIGIIVYSQTGNSQSVAEKLKDRLTEKGHTAEVEQVVPAGEVSPGTKEVHFKSKPDVEAYEALVFGSPVQAFSLAAAMKAWRRGASGTATERTAFEALMAAFPDI